MIAVWASLATLASAGPITLLRDINPTVRLGTTTQKPAAVAGGWVLNVCTDRVGCEPWFTDGTSAGTRMIKDLTPEGLPWYSDPHGFVTLGSHAYFSARQAASGLWKTDGTANGTVWVSDLSADTQPVVVGSAMYYVHGEQLVRSDGTAAGTVVLADHVQSIGPEEALAAAGPYVLFSRYDGTDTELWRTDGTVAGTQLLVDTVPGGGMGNPTSFRSTGDRAYFIVTNGFDTELWSSNGTVAGTSRIAIDGATGIAFNGRYFFVADGGQTYASLGTAATTVAYFSGSPAVATSNAIYFTRVTNASTTMELWKSGDGVSPPTLVAAFPQYRYPDSFVAAGSTLYFRLPGTGGGTDEIWKSDGTGAGTGVVSSDLFAPAFAVGDVVIGSTGAAAWRSDGTGAGTTVITPPASQPNNDSQCASGRINFGGLVYFAANDGVHGCELWRTDGTAAGTVLFKDLFAGVGGQFNDDDQLNFTIAGGTLFFTSNGGTGLWKTDGTPGGTVLVKGFHFPNAVNEMAAAGSMLLLSMSPAELWQSDGTDAGTVLLQGGFTSELVGSKSLGPHEFVASGPYVYFSARSVSSSASEVWRTDLTAGGTVKLQSFAAGSVFSKMAFGSGIVFAAGSPMSGPSSGIELWKSDGSVAGTVIVSDLNAGSARGLLNTLTVLGDHVYWHGTNGTQAGLWRSDGTSLGTEFVGALPDTPVGAPPVVAGDRFFYLGSGHVVVSDGTLAGTTPLISLGSGGSGFHNIRKSGSSIYFSPFEAGVGNELWRASPTAAGSGLLDDFVVGTGGMPGALEQTLDLEALASGLLVATANDVVGREPFFFAFDSAPYAAIMMANAQVTVSEDVGNATIEVQRVGDTSVAASATYSTADVTTNPPPQYTSTSGTLTWDAGDASPRFILVPITNDAVFNGLASAFKVTLDTASTPLTPLSQTLVTIFDDDNSVQFSSASQTVSEGVASVSFTVTRTGTSRGQAQVHWSIGGTAVGGTDYIGDDQGWLTWDALDTTARTIVVPLVDDVIAEETKELVVTLSSPLNTKLGSVATSTAILDDDDRGIAFVSASYSAGEGSPNVTLQVKRTGPPNRSASVTWATANGTALAGQDFGARGNTLQRSGTITWLVGDATVKTIVIPILQDTVLEGPEAFAVSLSRPSAGYALVSPSMATVTIVDDELPLQSKVSFVSRKVLVVENGGDAVLTLHREAVGGFTVPLTVNYVTAAATALASSDFTARSGSVTWTTFDLEDKTISIPIVNNTVAEATESFKVNLSTTSPGARIETPDAFVVILDDDEVFPPHGAIPDGWSVPVEASAGWHVSNDAGSYEGVLTLRSDPIDDGQDAALELTREFAAGMITFRVRVSSEPGFDRLRFLVDGVERGAWSGTTITGWQLASIPVTAGPHTVRWSYEKDASGSVGQDAAWLDAVTLP